MPVQFVLGDKLPLVCEMVKAITDFSPGWYTYDKSKESQKRVEAINGYANALINMWGKAFGHNNITSFKYVKRNITKHLKEYGNIVYTSKMKTLKNMSYRQRNIFYRSMESSKKVFNIITPSVNPDEFDELRKTFFKKQCSPHREGYVSDLINLIHEQMKDRELNKSLEMFKEFDGVSSDFQSEFDD